MSLGNMFLFILQIIFAFLLIIVVLMQSSDEDSLSGIGAGAGQGKMLSHRSSADLITKITIFLGVGLLLNSFILTKIYIKKNLKENKTIVKDYFEEEEKKNNQIKNFPIIDNNK